MDNLAYIFGAGASCLSMPLVNNFKDRFQVFINYLRSNDLNSGNLQGSCQDFLNQIKAHASFDTFFKKLFHQRKENYIVKYKEVLLLYFLFEHLIAPSEYNLHADQTSRKEFIFDPRYDALIAGLLKPIKQKQEFYTNITFCTWNYDMNLLCALKNFLHIESPFFDIVKNKREDNLFKVSEQVDVYHFNGFIYHPILNRLSITSDGNKEAFDDLIENSFNETEDFAEGIKFAWEQDNLINSTIIEAINSSSTIVIVGYSFPLYNRLFDQEIINYELLAGKKVIIQDLNARNLAKIIETDFEIPKNLQNQISMELELYENCNSFSVPSNIFRLTN